MVAASVSPSPFGRLKRMILSYLLLISVLVVDAKNEEPFVCGVWIAKSSIPNAGLGIFAGKDFRKDEDLLPAGDLVIPNIDLESNQPGKWEFLWDEYTWDGASLFMDNEALNEMNAISPGFGAAVNCFLDLVNVKEVTPLNDNMGLHRSRDPGAGGFTTYWNRQTVAKRDIKAGQELFASYGNNWFTSRFSSMGPVPLKGDLMLANTFLESYTRLEKRINDRNESTAFVMDLWETFVWENPWKDTSRVLFSLPKEWNETRVAQNMTLMELRREQHSVSQEWMEKHGVCGDTITVKKSTLRQAGRGAFSRTTFKEGDVVAPFPLIHLPYRKRMQMYDLEYANGTYVTNDEKGVTSHQLTLNYCMGHNESTMLLCPYGTLSSHVNHNQSLANVKLEWADPDASNHDPTWLNKSLREIYHTPWSGMAMNLVATRTIAVGDEVFLDYGDEWEEAWQEHVRNWKPGAQGYRSAQELNDETKVVKTEFEQMHEPYPSNTNLRFCLAFEGDRDEWLPHWKNDTLEEYIVRIDEYYSDCEVMDRKEDEDGNTWYTIYITDRISRKNKKKRESVAKRVKNVPLEAFMFFDRPYTSDMHQPNAFRHDMRVPDHLFPEKWKNRKPEAVKEVDKQSESSSGEEL